MAPPCGFPPNITSQLRQRLRQTELINARRVDALLLDVGASVHSSGEVKTTIVVLNY